MWVVESPNMGCYNGNRKSDIENQLHCQALCEADIARCVGILYSYKVGMTQYCYLCKDDTLGSVKNEFGFYRNKTFKGKLF